MSSSAPAIRNRLVAWLALVSLGCSHQALRVDPATLAVASPELLERVRADPYNYFRLTNHEWTARVCEIFASDLPRQPIVQLHGDAHVEQYALMDDAWGLDDFDDSARGPALVDIVRFLGSVDLAARRRGWTRSREQLFDRFFDGYRRGLMDPAYHGPEPDIVRWVRAEFPAPARAAFLAWAETKMAPIPENAAKGVDAAMHVFARVVRRERADLPENYFSVVRAGYLHIGVGSASLTKILIRVRGFSDDSADDVVLEAKPLRSLEGLACLDIPRTGETFRVIVGSHQLGRLKHNILAAGPEADIPEITLQGERLRNWWIRSWEPSYREITLDDLRSVDDLSAIVYDSGVQLGAGSVHAAADSEETALRTRSLASIAALEPRLRRESENLVEELLRGWRDFRRR